MLALLKRRPHERAGFALYTAAVGQARAPHYYAVLGVPDSLDGRFDMVALFAFLLVDRLRTDDDARGPALAQAVFDAMFADMDQNLRQMGVGDLSVAKRVKAMWTAFNGRCHAYADALALSDQAALEAALARNVWRSETVPPGAAPLARELRAQQRHLAGLPIDALASGTVAFLPAGWA
jgi:cytochrome b pre-mRNA-processing protein 3